MSSYFEHIRDIRVKPTHGARLLWPHRWKALGRAALDDLRQKAVECDVYSHVFIFDEKPAVAYVKVDEDGHNIFVEVDDGRGVPAITITMERARRALDLQRRKRKSRRLTPEESFAAQMLEAAEAD